MPNLTVLTIDQMILTIELQLAWVHDGSPAHAGVPEYLSALPTVLPETLEELTITHICQWTNLTRTLKTIASARSLGRLLSLTTIALEMQHPCPEYEKRLLADAVQDEICASMSEVWDAQIEVVIQDDAFML